MPKVPIAVQTDFTGVFYANGNWSKQPAWTFNPPSQQVHPGNNKITWTLTAVNLPANYAATFPANGIAFKAAPPWPGTSPALQADGTIQADDNFQRGHPAQTYGYTTTVVLTPTGGSNGQSGTFSIDPDVQNESNVVKFVVE